jgi:hypothetical protein
MKIKKYLFSPFYYFLLLVPSLILANVGGVSGSNQFTVSSDGSSTTWKIVSVSVTGDPVFSGSVSSVSDNNLTFSTGLDDSNNTTYPFYASGSFNKDVQVPTLSPTISSESVTGLTITYDSGFDSDLTGFTNAPEIIVSPSDGGGTSATVTVSLGTGLNAGKITGYTIPESGSSYTNTPDVKVVGGPHFVRIIDEDSDYYGRVFLITNNSQTQLSLDMTSSSAAVSGETASASTFFAAGTLVEVVPAATLNSVFGVDSNLISGWTSTTNYRQPSAGDSIFLASQAFGYQEYVHLNSTRLAKGWYAAGSPDLANNAVIYPDEAIIIAKRKSGTSTFDIDVADSDAPARLYLPEYGSLFVANNPYGMKMLLAELIPSTSIGTGTSQFKPGSSADTEGIDLLTILDGSGWTTYWYKTGNNDGGITEMMQASARSGSGGSNALVATDLFIDSGTVTNIQSCSDAAGSNTVTNYNEGDYSKITITGSSQSNITGFRVTLADLQGYMLNDDGNYEVNATTGENVDTNGTGSIVYSNLNGTHSIVGSGSGFIVVEKQRDINFKSDEGSPVWNVGDLGSGYDGTAQWFAIGGNGTGAKGTVTTGGSFTVTSGGSGYTSAPQIVVSGGGWRVSTDATAPKGGVEIGASDGIIIRRNHSTGVSSYIELSNLSD